VIFDRAYVDFVHLSALNDAATSRALEKIDLWDLLTFFWCLWAGEKRSAPKA
jgi:hypothetical protein